MVRKFKKVAKTKKGVPKKYVQGAKNPKAQEAEIKRTAKKYKEGTLTKAEMVYTKKSGKAWNGCLLFIRFSSRSNANFLGDR
jgi:hypothetical protein